MHNYNPLFMFYAYVHIFNQIPKYYVVLYYSYNTLIISFFFLFYCFWLFSIPFLYFLPIVSTPGSSLVYSLGYSHGHTPGTSLGYSIGPTPGTSLGSSLGPSL